MPLSYRYAFYLSDELLEYEIKNIQTTNINYLTDFIMTSEYSTVLPAG